MKLLYLRQKKKKQQKQSMLGIKSIILDCNDYCRCKTESHRPDRGFR